MHSRIRVPVSVTAPCVSGILAAFNTRAFWKSNLINRWLGLRLDFLGGVLVLCTSLAAAASVGVPPGLAGLTLSYALFITGSLNWTVRQSAETEKFMASVERVLAFSSLPPEAAWAVPEHEPPASWPSEGAISLRNAVMRYRPELPPVLKGLTLDITAGEKVRERRGGGGGGGLLPRPPGRLLPSLPTLPRSACAAGRARGRAASCWPSSASSSCPRAKS